LATNVPEVRLDRIALTRIHLKALEMALYQMADVYDRVMLEWPQYTKTVAVTNELTTTQ